VLRTVLTINTDYVLNSTDRLVVLLETDCTKCEVRTKLLYINHEY